MDKPKTARSRVTKHREGHWTVASSGDRVTDALTSFFWHATAEMTPEQACILAEGVKDELIDDDEALDVWGVRLAAEVPTD